MEREVGGGIGMGNTCKPMAVSFQCMKLEHFLVSLEKTNTTKKKIKKNLYDTDNTWREIFDLKYL